MTVKLTQEQAGVVIHAMHGATVKDLKKLARRCEVSATYYNRAKKCDLVKTIAFRMDTRGVESDVLYDLHSWSQRHITFPIDECIAWDDIPDAAKGPQFYAYCTNLFMPGSSIARAYDELNTEHKAFVRSKDGDHSGRFWTRHAGMFVDVIQSVQKSPNTVKVGSIPPTMLPNITNEITAKRVRFEFSYLLHFEGDEHEWRIYDADARRVPPIAFKVPLDRNKPQTKSITPLEPAKEPVINTPKQDPFIVTDPPVAASVAPAAGGLEAIIGDIIKSSVGDTVEKQLSDMGVTQESVHTLVLKVISDKAIPQVIPRKNPKQGDPPFMLVHKSYDAAKFWLDMGHSVYLNGPAGSGKTVAAQQLAEQYGMTCTIISCHGEMTVYDLCGFRDGHGEYNETPFFVAWRDGHIILMDEVDKSPGEVNVFLNAATAQGVITFPNGETLTKKDDCKIILTGNTKMSGADAIYSAGQRQDGSFSNRLVAIDWPFDENLEMALAIQESLAHGGTENNGKNVMRHVEKIRDAVESLGMTYVVGQRQTMMASAGTAAGRKMKDVFSEVVYGWMDPRDAERIIERVGNA